MITTKLLNTNVINVKQIMSNEGLQIYTHDSNIININDNININNIDIVSNGNIYCNSFHTENLIIDNIKTDSITIGDNTQENISISGTSIDFKNQTTTMNKHDKIIFDESEIIDKYNYDVILNEGTTNISFKQFTAEYQINCECNFSINSEVGNAYNIANIRDGNITLPFNVFEGTNIKKCMINIEDNEYSFSKEDYDINLETILIDPDYDKYELSFNIDSMLTIISILFKENSFSYNIIDDDTEYTNEFTIPLTFLYTNFNKITRTEIINENNETTYSYQIQEDEYQYYLIPFDSELFNINFYSENNWFYSINNKHPEDDNYQDEYDEEQHINLTPIMKLEFLYNIKDNKIYTDSNGNLNISFNISCLNSYNFKYLLKNFITINNEEIIISKDEIQDIRLNNNCIIEDIYLNKCNADDYYSIDYYLMNTDTEVSNPVTEKIINCNQLIEDKLIEDMLIEDIKNKLNLINLNSQNNLDELTVLNNAYIHGDLNVSENVYINGALCLNNYIDILDNMYLYTSSVSDSDFDKVLCYDINWNENEFHINRIQDNEEYISEQILNIDYDSCISILKLNLVSDFDSNEHYCNINENNLSLQYHDKIYNEYNDLYCVRSLYSNINNLGLSITNKEDYPAISSSWYESNILKTFIKNNEFYIVSYKKYGFNNIEEGDQSPTYQLNSYIKLNANGITICGTITNISPDQETAIDLGDIDQF